jgi:hypothetical protein
MEIQTRKHCAGEAAQKVKIQTRQHRAINQATRHRRTFGQGGELDFSVSKRKRTFGGVSNLIGLKANRLG